MQNRRDYYSEGILRSPPRSTKGPPFDAIEIECQVEAHRRTILVKNQRGEGAGNTSNQAIPPRTSEQYGHKEVIACEFVLREPHDGGGERDVG